MRAKMTNRFSVSPEGAAWSRMASPPLLRVRRRLARTTDGFLPRPRAWRRLAQTTDGFSPCPRVRHRLAQMTGRLSASHEGTGAGTWVRARVQAVGSRVDG
jgi:hypothetical protein